MVLTQWRDKAMASNEIHRVVVVAILGYAQPVILHQVCEGVVVLVVIEIKEAHLPSQASGHP